MKNIFNWLLVAVILICIYFLSDIPYLHLIREEILPFWVKKLSSRYIYRIGNEGFFSYVFTLHPDFILHKIGHVMVYGLLAISIYFACGRSNARAIILTAVAATLDEWHQYFVPGRSSRFGDIILDTVAGIIFIVILRAITRRKEK